MKKKILVVVAHPDDEILGCGGTIIKHVEKGDHVCVCVATKAYTPYWTEEYIEEQKVAQHEVDSYLKIKQRFHLDYATVKLNMVPTGTFNQAVADVVNEVKPDIIYTHDPCDLNNDHKVVFQSCLVATRPPKKIALYTFETLSESEWGETPFQPNTYVILSENEVATKMKAMSFYRLELKPRPHPRNMNGILSLAKHRGLQVCEEYAEAFRLIRKVIVK